MTRQEQTFIAYYASVTDPEMLRVGSNRTSFIGVAQTILADEFVKPNLVVPLAVPADAAVQFEPPAPNVFKRLTKMFVRVRRH
jgi:hypothetical protein